MVFDPDPAAHMIVNFLQNYMTEAGEAAPRIATGRWSRPWKSLSWPNNSTTSSFRKIIRDNEIDSLRPISYDLVTWLVFQGILGEVLHAELIPSCSHTQSPALCHICLLCPFQSYLVSVGSSGSLSHTPPPGPRMPLPWPPVLLGRMPRMYRWTQDTQSLQPFWASSRGGATNYLLGAAMVRHFCSGSIRSFHLEGLRRCLSWDSRDQWLISFQIDWFDLIVL